MAKKKAAVKKVTKKAAKVDPSSGGDTGQALGEPDVPAEVTERSLAAGTVVRFPGSNTDLILKGGAAVTYVDVANDQKFAGMLARHKENFNLNIGQLEGVWSPVTARREE